MKYAHLIFDLDGTLVDSATEIHDAAVAVCSEHGLSVPSLDYIRTMTGTPPRQFFLDHGCDEVQVDARVVEFRAHLADNAGDPDCVFSAVLPVFEQLQEHSIRCAPRRSRAPWQLPCWSVMAWHHSSRIFRARIHRYGISRTQISFRFALIMPLQVEWRWLATLFSM